MLLLIALGLILALVALTRPRRLRGQRDRYRPRRVVRPLTPLDPTIGLRDPSRPL
jgi:hypothetical protein